MHTIRWYIAFITIAVNVGGVVGSSLADLVTGNLLRISSFFSGSIQSL